MNVSRLMADTRPLRNPHFRRLWTANIITVVGAQLTVVAVPAQIYSITGSSAFVGLTGVFGLVPLVVFGLYGGALADVFDRRTLLVVTTVGLIVTSALFWAQAAAGNTNVWLLLGLFSLQQAFFAVNQPTRSAVIPKLVEPALLPAANSLNMTVGMAGAIAGPLVAGILIPFIGFSWLYLLDTITLFATLGAVLRLPRLPVFDRAPGVPGMRAVIDGFSYLRTQPILMMSFVVDLIAMVSGMPRALSPEMANLNFGGPSEGGWCSPCCSPRSRQAPSSAGSSAGGSHVLSDMVWPSWCASCCGAPRWPDSASQWRWPTGGRLPCSSWLWHSWWSVVPPTWPLPASVPRRPPLAVASSWCWAS